MGDTHLLATVVSTTKQKRVDFLPLTEKEKLMEDFQGFKRSRPTDNEILVKIS